MIIKSANHPNVLKIKDLQAQIEKIKADIVLQCKIKEGDMVEVEFVSSADFTLHGTVPQKTTTRKAQVLKVEVSDSGDLIISFLKVNKNGKVSNQEDHFQDSIRTINIKKV